MRKLILTGIVVLVSGPAAAADVPAQAAPAPAYAAVPFFDWTGFYLGANGGSAGGRSHFDFNGMGVHPSAGGFVSRIRLSKPVA